jgi:hypothetical protein
MDFSYNEVTTNVLVAHALICFNPDLGLELGNEIWYNIDIQDGGQTKQCRCLLMPFHGELLYNLPNCDWLTNNFLDGSAIVCELESFVLPTLYTVPLWVNEKASANWSLKHLLQKCDVHTMKSVYQIWKKYCCIFNGTSCVYLIIMIWFEYQVLVKLLRTINIPPNMCWPLLQSCSPATPLAFNYCMVTLETGCSIDSQLTVPIVPSCFMTIHFIEHNVMWHGFSLML